MILSVRIERAFTKDQILELYLNQIYLGAGAYGVAAAAQAYWNKSLPELTIADCAYLATLPKAPSSYSPFKNPTGAIARRNWVIDRMVENGFVTHEDGEKAKAEPLGVTRRQTGIKSSGQSSTGRRCAATSSISSGKTSFTAAAFPFAPRSTRHYSVSLARPSLMEWSPTIIGMAGAVS